MQWDPETSGPLGHVGNWVLKLSLLLKGGDFDRQMSNKKSMSPWCKQMFLGKEKGPFTPG
jgi:hypothetical protein